MNKLYHINQSFGSRPIYVARLKKKLPLIPITLNKDVFISELDETDKKRLIMEKKIWARTTYGINIIENFLNEFKKRSIDRFLFNRYYIVEDKHNKIKGLVYTEIEECAVRVSLLQSEREKKGKYSTQGVGTCLLYTVLKLAQSLKMNCVTINSIPEAIEFYKKIGAQRIGKQIFVITKHNYQDFQKCAEEKYSINKIG